MSESLELREHALQIWRAGVDAVASERLVQSTIRAGDSSFVVCSHSFDTSVIERIAVVGAGKAGAGMAAAVEEAFRAGGLEERLSGWINVPADCVRPLDRIYLHPARPAGVNEPTIEGVNGANEIVRIVTELGANDLCLVLLSGGGSALLPLPVSQITLEDKQTVTRLLMHSGATINELNCVRKQLSGIKGGKLARACNAGRLITLIISDVIGDPLDVIASGPTVDDPSTPAEAAGILERLVPNREAVPESVWKYLAEAVGEWSTRKPIGSTVSNHVIGNNAIALSAAAERARELGYRVQSLGSENTGEARAVGQELAELAERIRDEHDPTAPRTCILSGGEPIVRLAATDRPRKGGRNQELALAAIDRLWDSGLDRIVILSGGTDGEDGPTDAAGGIADAEVLRNARSQQLAVEDFLAINNSYPFMEQTGGLIRTGPTHTNVMDLRVVLVGR